MKLMNIYTTSFYGSSLYRLYSNQCDKLYHAYNICVRNIFSVPRRTHTYLIETISECLHPKVMICARFVKFVKSLNNCNKSGIYFLIKLVQNDNRTVCGKNMAEIASLCNIEKNVLSSHEVKQHMKYSKIPESEVWRENMLTEMLLYRNCDFIKIDNFLKQEIDDIIDVVCTM